MIDKLSEIIPIKNSHIFTIWNLSTNDKAKKKVFGSYYVLKKYR